ncbi:uncharacterized protein V6R79_024313 [Siganus canaliculatus]
MEPPLLLLLLLLEPVEEVKSGEAPEAQSGNEVSCLEDIASRKVPNELCLMCVSPV